MRHVILGLTGPTGAGKSTVAGLLAGLGFAVIDADQVAREVMEPGSPLLSELRDRFGGDILREDGSLNRKLLAARAFSSKEGSAALNAITHPAICRRAKSQMEALAAAGNSFLLFDAPLLFESGADQICDVTACVVADEERRLARILARDGISRDEGLLRMSAQPPASFYTGRCDYVLENNGDAGQLKTQVKALMETLRGRITG